MSPTEFSNYIKQRAMQKSLQQQGSGGFQQQQQQQQGNGFYDKFYSPNSPSCYGSANSNGSNMNFNNFPKSLTSPGGSSDYNNFGLGSSGLNNSSSGGSFGGSGGLNLSDYSSLLDQWPDSVDQDTNAFLQDILSSAGVGGCSTPAQARPAGSGRGLLGGGGHYDDWVGGGGGLGGFNANHPAEQHSGGLGPESRSSSTKSMSSGSEHSLPSPPGLQADGARDSFGIQRVLVAN
jgi:hypothetical protein